MPDISIVILMSRNQNFDLKLGPEQNSQILSGIPAENPEDLESGGIRNSARNLEIILHLIKDLNT